MIAIIYNRRKRNSVLFRPRNNIKPKKVLFFTFNNKLFISIKYNPAVKDLQ